MNEYKTNEGFTLIEMILYVLLFTVIIGGGVGSAFYLMQGTDRMREFVLREAEANFVFRKIDWMLNDADSIVTPTAGNSSDVLEVSKGANVYKLEVIDSQFVLNGDYITTTDINVVSSNFFHTPASGGSPEALELRFLMDGKAFGTSTKYLR